jgi:PAS domain S-box-containing protein
MYVMQEKTQFVHSNEAYYRSAPGLYFSKDINGVYTACNDAFARLVGMGLPEEVIGKNDYELSWREQANTLRENDQQVITSGQEKVFEEFVISTNGERMTYLATKRPLFDNTHTIVGLSGFLIDITKYKEEARDALLNLEQVVKVDPSAQTNNQLV